MTDQLDAEDIEHFAHELADLVRIDAHGWRERGYDSPAAEWLAAGYDSATQAAEVLLGDYPSPNPDITARAIKIVAQRLARFLH